MQGPKVRFAQESLQTLREEAAAGCFPELGLFFLVSLIFIIRSNVPHSLQDIISNYVRISDDEILMKYLVLSSHKHTNTARERLSLRQLPIIYTLTSTHSIAQTVLTTGSDPACPPHHSRPTARPGSSRRAGREDITQ